MLGPGEEWTGSLWVRGLEREREGPDASGALEDRGTRRDWEPWIGAFVLLCLATLNLIPATFEAQRNGNLVDFSQ